MLHVAPGQRGIRLQRKRADAGRDGRAGRRSRVRRRTDSVWPQVAILIDGRDAGVVARCA